ncbi:DUF1127 domain-containing protein [Halomonas sp. GXIMD04776]|uniref:DUF1127 domain-containing protein n=1 Tax=Halomonas sp. GXIMD04776 TaxID=3415605 RepID=UPI003CA6CC2C
MMLIRLNRLFARLRDHQQNHCSRQRLLELDTHQLKDIGLSRADAVREGCKPFWKA